MKYANTPSHWSQLLRGSYLAEQYQRRLDDWSPALFGDHLLKVDALSVPLSFKNSRVLHTVNLSQAKHPAQERAADVLGDSGAMPFAPGSVDACLLAHVLDFSEHPHGVLREVETLLRDDGWLIITGFNPYSSAGILSLLLSLRLNAPSRRPCKLPPWRQMLAPGRLEDWLKLLGFEVVKRDYVTLSRWCHASSEGGWRQRIYGRYCPSLSAAYIIMARKRRYPLTPIRQYHTAKQSLQAGMACRQSLNSCSKWKAKDP